MHELDPSSDHPVRAEIFHAARLCVPCLDRLGVLTYEASPLNGPLRDQWRESVLVKHLLPAVSKAHVAIGNHGFRELLETDATLDGSLSGPLAVRSSSAGRMLAMDHRPPAAERTLTKYFAAVESGQSSGHLATVLAARAAVFHISPQMALSALVFLEMRAAPVAEFWKCVEGCLKGVPQAGNLLRAA